MRSIYLPPVFPSSCASYGFSNAQSRIREALELKGATFSIKAGIELHHMSSHLYKRSWARKSILWFPYEADVIHSDLINHANKADELIASCPHNRDVFMSGGITIPIHVCNLGVDADKYRPSGGKNKDVFIFLWVGQNNIRKGWDLVSKAFAEEFSPNENVRLYMKTTAAHFQEVYQVQENIIVDSRNISEADMLDLYSMSHAFVFPSRGEGTGLPAMEAMACGSLVIAPPIQGMKEFVTEGTALTLEHELVGANYGIDMKVPSAKMADLKKKMRIAYEQYDSFSGVINEGVRLIHNRFSLNSMGNALVKILWGS